MNKTAVLILLFSLGTLGANAQKDFDFKLTTCKIITATPDKVTNDTCVVTKSGNLLTIKCGKNRLLYSLEFLGVKSSETGAQTLVYAITGDHGQAIPKQYVYADPFAPRITVAIDNNYMLLE